MNTGVELTELGSNGKLFGWSVLRPEEVSQVVDSGITVEEVTKSIVEAASERCPRTRKLGGCGLAGNVTTNTTPGGKSLEFVCESNDCKKESSPTVFAAHRMLAETMNGMGIKERRINDTSTRLGDAVLTNIVDQN